MLLSAIGKVSSSRRRLFIYKIIRIVFINYVPSLCLGAGENGQKTVICPASGAPCSPPVRWGMHSRALLRRHGRPIRNRTRPADRRCITAHRPQSMQAGVQSTSDVHVTHHIFFFKTRGPLHSWQNSYSRPTRSRRLPPPTAQPSISQSLPSHLPPPPPHPPPNTEFCARN